MSTLGRWLQPPPKGSLEQQYQELVNLLKTKEKVLETTSHELKVKTAAMQILEQKVMSSETQSTSAQRELTARREQLMALEAELAARSNRLADLEAEGITAHQQVSEFKSIVAAQTEELRSAHQAHEVLKEEIRVLREHNAQLNEGLADRGQIRARMEKLESAQDRVHQLEVELSNREAAHRAMIQQFERSLVERDRRISKVDASAVAQADKLHEAQQACRAAEQAQEVLKEETRVLRDQIAQLNEGLPARERLRAQVKELEPMRNRVHQLEVELSNREAVHRGTIQQLEQSITERDHRISEFDSFAAAQADEVRDTLETCRTAEQAREVQKEEIRVLRDQIAQLNEGLAERERLRAQVKKLESARDRVHQLEVELSDREAVHRGTIQQLERALAERDQQIGEFDASAITQADELRGAQLACQTAEQAQEVLKEETRVLRDQIAQLYEGLADRDQLRAQVKKLESARDRVHQLEVELSDRETVHRGMIQQLEQSIAERDRRVSEFDSLAAAQADEVQDALEACRTAEQAREVQKEEIRVLRDQIAQLNKDLVGRDRLRAQVEKLESTQARVHQLEVELSDREAAHRGTIQQLERALADRDHRIDELVPVTHLLHEKEATIKEWKRTHARTVQDLEVETAKLQESCASQDQLQAQHQLDKQELQERDVQIANLQRELQDLKAERQNLAQAVQNIPGKDEQIDRLQQRIKELRATLRDNAVPTKATSSKEAPRQARQNGAETNSQGGQPKIGKEKPEDDLKKIHGIGSAFAQTLQKMGTRTFIQIARWKQEDIEKIAKKLETDPERIKREKWIADAKKQHYQKYGERL